MKKLPKKVKVGFAEYTVIYPYVFEDDPTFVGYHDGPNCELKISSHTHNVRRADIKIYETLLHEIVHAIDYIYCCCSMNETEVTQLAKGLLHVLRENNLYLNDRNKMPKEVNIGGFTYNVDCPYEVSEGVVSSIVKHESLSILLAGGYDGRDFNWRILKKNFLTAILCSIRIFSVQTHSCRTLSSVSR
jgi:hypothetical protein